MKKRFLSALLALILCAGLAVPVFASDAFGPYTTSKGTDGVIFSYDVSGAYTISEGADSITFSAAKVERKTLQRREYLNVAGAGYSAYKTEVVTVVTIRPDTRITVANENGYFFDMVRMDGSNQFTTYICGSGNGVHIVNGIGSDAFINMPPNANSFSSYAICELGYVDTYYILMMETDFPTFTDVSAGAFYADAVNWAVGQDITNGTGSGKFSPTQDCTHAQILTFLYRAERGGGAAAPEDMNKAISWARDKGMIGADFNSSAKCTRADAVNYIWQAFGKEIRDIPACFLDIPFMADYSDAVNWAVANGIAEGTGGGNFSPDKVCNRGTIVTLLHRAYVPAVRLPYW